ncbi:efflux RND transporter periplasmic adaptor subunit [Rheinheimera metallidurans]|uniref:efflux RND transporter periplasmic adaptor subunit n=1 Tax=Rheinheimera metallidurans TaxID=2925781 RepID=UPI0030013ABE
MLKKLSLSPVIIAVILSFVLLLWLFSGDNYGAKNEAPEAQKLPQQQLALVETRWSDAQPYQATQVAQGQILPWRSVSIKSQQAGTVEAVLKQQGDAVKQGDKLLQLSNEGRSALLAQAKANLTLRNSELDSAKALGKAKFLSATELTRLQSEQAKAQAELITAELAISQRSPEAPFNGIVDRRHIEVGDLVQVGSELMQLVQIDQLKVTAQIAQQDIAALSVGQNVTLRLLDGRTLNGTLSFISYAADNATRSFYIEVTVNNPELLRIAGVSVTVEVQLGDIAAHRISPALLSLNASGQLGISAVNEQQQVKFYSVTLLSADNDGAWVSGLPQRVQIITQGAGFVQPGSTVRVAGAKP